VEAHVKPATVLVVEDNPITRKMVRLALQSAGYEALEAGDGATALELATRHTVALVLQDLLLPDIDGIELCRLLRATPGGTEMPIIAFSGLQSRLEEARSLHAGFADYLFKPVAPSRLLEVIRAYLPMSAGPTTEPGRGRRILLVDDDPVQLKLNTIQLEAVGFRVVAARGAAEALDRARQAPPDAVVTDVLMPEMNGLELCLAVRADARLAHIPLVLASSTFQYIEDADRAMARDVGANALVPRNYGIQEVIAALLESLSAGPPPRPSGEAQPIPSRYMDRCLRQVELQASLNAKLTQRSALDTALLSIISSAAAVLTRRLDLQHMLDEVLGCALDAGGVSAGAIYLVEPEQGPCLRSQVGYSDRAEHLDFFGHGELLREIIRQGQPVQIPGLSLPDGVADDVLSAARAVSIVVAPLVTDDDPFGALVMMTGRRELEDRWLASISAVATQLAQAVALSRTVEATAERARLAELNAEVGSALAGSAPLRDTLQRCAESLVRHLDATFARIWTICGDDVLELQASAGRPTGLDVLGSRVSLGQTEIGRIAQNRQPLVSKAQAADLSIGDQEWARREGAVAFAGYPLVVGDELVGVMALFAQKPFPAFAQRALAAVADGMAVGIQRGRAEEELRATQARLQHVITSSAAVMYVLRVDGAAYRTIWISDNIGRIMGYDMAEAMAPGWWADRVHPEDRERLRGEENLLAKRGQLAHTYRFRRKDGVYRWILDDHRLVRSIKGDGAEIVGSWLDVTERRSLEEQFLQAQKMEAIGRLAGGVAHDFNNLLTVISSFAELTLHELLPHDPLHDNLDEIRKAAKQATGLTRQLLAFSRRQVLAPRVHDLNEVVADIEGMLRRLVGEDIEVTCVLAPDLGRVKADPGQVQQVIANLAVNARDAMIDGGKLTIETANADIGEEQSRGPVKVPAGRYVVLAVSDTGTGMDQETQTRVFEPFFTTKEPGKGTGLGLSTVYGIVKQSGGFIWVYSELDHGSTFRVYLPRVDQPAMALASESPGLSIRGGSETLLVAEDDEAVCNLVRTALAQRGYQVLAGASGGEALMLCEAHSGPIDLLITDVVMPGLGGRELFHRLACLRPDLKVLFVSGYAERAVAHHGEIEPGTAFLEKPFTPDSLARKVREVLDLQVAAAARTGGGPGGMSDG
jgi:PAS domain S-box-containing protein